MSDHGDNFRDDELAAAVRRCWGEQCCPADLRDRLAAMKAGGPAPRTFQWRGRVARTLEWTMAAAAAVAVVAGLGHLLHVGGPTAIGPPAAVVPVSLEAELVQTHDHCGRGADHQRLPVPRTNGYAIAASFRSQLDRPVLVSRRADDGWRFAGASVCPVGDVRSAHLLFRRDDGDTLSIFSLPRSVAPAAVDGQQFQGEVGHHLILGFVRRRAVYCLVANGCPHDVSAEKLADLRRQLERQVVVADGPNPVVPPGGELMHEAGE
jgi:hypothetical protein